MNATIRLSRPLFRDIRADLQRVHTHAFERVGFVFVRLARTARGVLLVAFAYAPVPDEDYIVDRSVGARINSRAIRGALQRALSHGDGVLHVHVHEHFGTPAFSTVDRATLMALMPSFHAVARSAAHGGLVLSQDRAAGVVCIPGQSELTNAKVSLVGFPLTICGGANEGPL